jgi:hypothetical protein
MELDCPVCKKTAITIGPFDYDRIGARVICPHCGTVSRIVYDETYTEETGDVDDEWYLMVAPPS